MLAYQPIEFSSNSSKWYNSEITFADVYKSGAEPSFLQDKRTGIMPVLLSVPNSCKYDFADTYIDRKRKVSLKNVNEAIEYSEDELLNCLINSYSSNLYPIPLTVTILSL